MVLRRTFHSHCYSAFLSLKVFCLFLFYIAIVTLGGELAQCWSTCLLRSLVRFWARSHTGVMDYDEFHAS